MDGCLDVWFFGVGRKLWGEVLGVFLLDVLVGKVGSSKFLAI